MTVLILSLIFLLSMGPAADNQYQSVKICRKAAASVDRNGAEFVADISHDLKTPISVIMANNSILKSNKDSSVADNMQWIESMTGLPTT